MILSHRLPYAQYETDAQFARVMAFLLEHRAVVDEICLFSDKTNYACWPLEWFAESARLMGQRLAQLREAGFVNLGINMLSTLGHLDDVSEHFPLMAYPPMVGHDGRVAQTCPCPNAPEYRAYLQAKFRLAAEAQPDFIWVDDDFRMHSHGPIGYACFCPVCLRKFDPRYTSREALLARLNAPDGGEVRRAWVSNNERVLTEIAEDVEQAVHAVDPRIELGLMSSGPRFSTYSGQAFHQWMGALQGHRSRPGGGFYDDYSPNQMFPKAFDMGRQVQYYPPTVTNIQYELENCPCLALDKSVQTLLNECMLSFAMGCNGVAFSSLGSGVGTLEDYQPLYRTLESERTVWEAYLQAAQGTSLAGLWMPSDGEMMAKLAVKDGDWFSRTADYTPDLLTSLIQVGIPVTVDRRASCATLLAGRMAECFTDNELHEILSGGVMVDAEALQVLWERGLGELTGVRLGASYTNSTWERFTAHPLNGAYADDSRWVFQAYFGSTTWELQPVTEGVESLSILMRADDAELGMCGSAYENALGGRVITLGYLPWTRLTTHGKRAQMLAMADWVSRGTLPVIIDAPCRVAPLLRVSEDGKRVALLLLNTGFDPISDLTVRLRACPSRLVWKTAAGEQQLRMTQSGGETKIHVPGLMPWRVMVIVGE